MIAVRVALHNIEIYMPRYSGQSTTTIGGTVTPSEYTMFIHRNSRRKVGVDTLFGIPQIHLRVHRTFII